MQDGLAPPKKRTADQQSFLVAPKGIEPLSWVPETHVLSVELRRLLLFGRPNNVWVLFITF